MTYKELSETLRFREITFSYNNMIIMGNYSEDLIRTIPTTTGISFPKNNIDIAASINIPINLAEINIKDILTYALNYLKELKLVDPSFDYTLPFIDQYSVKNFVEVLHNYNRVVQLIFYNIEYLSLEEQKIFNELYYYSGPFFSVITFTNEEFKTYALSYDRELQDGINYQKHKIMEPYTLSKKNPDN